MKKNGKNKNKNQKTKLYNQEVDENNVKDTKLEETSEFKVISPSQDENHHTESNDETKIMKIVTEDKNHLESEEKPTELKEKKMKHKKEKKVKKQKEKKKHKVLKRVILIFFILIFLAIIAGSAIFAGMFFSDKWAITKDDLVLSKINTNVYDKDGNVIATVSGDEKRKIATLEEIPQYLKDAFVSIEDETFYEHHGINLKRTLGAVATYIIHRGDSSFGGSTITQQLIKNILGDKARSGMDGVERKIREMSRAYQVENILSKDQILELYLNIIFMGGDVYGVELGSEYYFNKPLAELDLAECAFLAGINHSPNNYNPFDGTDRTEKIKNRTKTVLWKMNQLGKISEEEYNTARDKVNEGLTFSKGNSSSASTMSYLAKAALNQVVKQYSEEKGLDEETAKTMIYGGGYKIYSTQDSNIQSIMEEVYRDEDYIVWSNDIQVQSAMAIIDHKTGQVVGMMGGLGNDVDSNGLNRATQSTRQPGSSMKPIASIAPGLEKGVITAGTVYNDNLSYFGSYHPKNSGNSYHGLITVRNAIEISANVVEVKIMSELGPRNSIEFLREKMGVTSLVTATENPEHNDENLSMVLGGITNGISPLEMAGAYATIANNGEYITPTMYTRMEDSAGNVVLECVQNRVRAMSEANAFIEKSILTGPVVGGGGTARNCSISGFDVGAKTGTTNDNTDRWLCGFTNYYTAATWYGYDTPQVISAGRTNPASRIWIAIMRRIHEGLEGSRFEKPDSVTSATICMDSGKVATESCTRTYTEYYVRGTIPGKCEGHKKLTICTDTGKIATEFCPHKEEKTYVVKPDKENTTMWRSESEEIYEIPTETCTTHVKKIIEMPKVVGLKTEDATKKLKDLGLVVTVTTKTSTDSDGIVLTQSKEPLAKLTEGDSVTITVSKKETKKTSTNTTTNTITNTTSPTKNEISTNTDSTSTNTVQNKTTP